jgi:hypothetical protein
MELLCALLTGIFLWLFFFHWRRSAVARAREAAGALLVTVKPPRSLVWMTRWTRIPFALMMLAPWAMFLYFRVSRTSASDTLFDDYMISFLLFNFLQATFPSFRFDSPVELRERGVVRSVGWTLLLPWNEVTGCRWYEGWPTRPVVRRSQYFERRVHLPDEVEAVTATAGRFVPVYDVEGKLIVEPAPADRAALTVSPGRFARWRFQFSLQSLLLLMVVVSCAASCYGIHYRRARPQNEAIAALNVFYPQLYYSGDNVWMLDFKGCSVKPGDDDLMRVEALGSLEHLDLDGSPVTDAGLKHLYRLKTLKSVSLSNTKVTQQGIDDLQKQLPGTTILCYPSPPAGATANGK